MDTYLAWVAHTVHYAGAAPWVSLAKGDLHWLAAPSASPQVEASSVPQ